jgi:hypothetical protein
MKTRRIPRQKLKTIAAAMAGATAEHKKRIRAASTADEYDEVVAFTTQILSRLPDSPRTGSIKTALMLAAVAYAEYGPPAALALVDEERAQRRKRRG